MKKAEEINSTWLFIAIIHCLIFLFRLDYLISSDFTIREQFRRFRSVIQYTLIIIFNLNEISNAATLQIIIRTPQRHKATYNDIDCYLLGIIDWPLKWLRLVSFEPVRFLSFSYLLIHITVLYVYVHIHITVLIIMYH